MEPAATRRVHLMDVLIANPSYPPYLAPFLANGESLEVGNFRETALYTGESSEKPVNESDDT